MKDFFISYTGVNKDNATWVAELLEKNNYTVTIQEWDFKPGDNFVSKINEALIECRKMIVILSENYLKSSWCEAEWTSKLVEQMSIKEQIIIPIRIEPVKLSGLLSAIVYIDIVDKEEKQAEFEILNGIKGETERKSTRGYPTYYNLEYLQIDNDYYVYENEIVFIKTYTFKVLSDGFNKLHNRITWFSDEKITVESETIGVTIEHLNLRDTNYNYNLVFDRYLKKDEEFTVRIKAKLTNKNKHFDNFFSTEIITPVRNLSIHLNINDVTVEKVTRQKISNSPMNVRNSLPEEFQFNSPFHWNITDPEINFEYKLYW